IDRPLILKRHIGRICGCGDAEVYRRSTADFSGALQLAQRNRVVRDCASFCYGNCSLVLAIAWFLAEPEVETHRGLETPQVRFGIGDSTLRSLRHQSASVKTQSDATTLGQSHLETQTVVESAQSFCRVERCEKRQ